MCADGTCFMSRASVSSLAPLSSSCSLNDSLTTAHHITQHIHTSEKPVECLSACMLCWSVLAYAGLCRRMSLNLLSSSGSSFSASKPGPRGGGRGGSGNP